MAHTSEDRDRLARPLCGVMTKRGVPCRAFAGQGVPGNHGVGPCKHHGGATTSHKKHAVAVEAKQHMITLGQPIDVAPAQALIGMLRASAGHSMWLGQRVAELDEDGLGDLRAEALVRLYSEERDRCARVAKACLDSGVDNGMVKLAEETTQAVMRAVYVAAVEVGMTRDQARRFGPAFQRALTTAEA